MDNKTSSIPVSSLASLSDAGFVLRAAGERKNLPYSSHRDDYYLFGVMQSGRQSVAVDFREITIERRQALIIAPGQVHGPIDNPSDSGFIIAFSPESIKQSEMQLIEEYSLKTRPIDLNEFDYKDINILYEMLLRRSNRNSEVEYSIASTIKSIILQQISQEESGAPNRYVRLVVNLRKLLKENITREKSPSAYAEMMNISSVYLNEAVNFVTGMSTSNYIISFALLCAKREMIYTDLSTQEIAFRLGYEDYSYFSRLFRRHVGESPREFRSKYRK